MSLEDKYQALLEKISSELERIRKEKGFTQKHVAFNCDMEEQNYRRIEKGLTNPTLKSLVRICEVLEIELKDLF